MVHRARISLQFSTEQEARVIWEAIKLEQEAIPNPRVKVESKVEGKILQLMIVAQDLVALRAGINSHLKWVRIASESFNEV